MRIRKFCIVILTLSTAAAIVSSRHSAQAAGDALGLAAGSRMGMAVSLLLGTPECDALTPCTPAEACDGGVCVPGGACCFFDPTSGGGPTCLILTEGECLNQHGVFHGTGNDCSGVDCRLAGPDCAGAVLIPKDDQIHTFDGNEGWVKFTALDASTHVDTCGTFAFDTVVRVYDDCNAGELRRNDNCDTDPSLGTNSDPTAACYDPTGLAGVTASCTALPTIPGTLYYVFVRQPASRGAGRSTPSYNIRIRSGPAMGACCFPDGSCQETTAANCGSSQSNVFVCDVADHLPATFAGCFGDVDGNGTVNAGDRGFIAANIDNHDPVAMCLYDLDGNGVINAGDRGFVAANIGACASLPDYQNGSGGHGDGPDLRFGPIPEQGVYQGDGTLCSEASCNPPENDECEGAILISGPLPATVTGSTSDATVSPEPPALNSCGTPHDSADVWYRVIGTGNTMTATTCNAGTNFDTKLHVYCGSCERMFCAGGNDDGNTPDCALPNGGQNYESRVTWCSASGTEYFILVHGFGGATGDFELNVSDNGETCMNPPLCGPPLNDECGDAEHIPGPLPQSAFGSTTDATPSPVPPVIADCGTLHDGSNDVWYTVTGTGATMTATTCTFGTDFDTRLHVYCGSCSATTCVAGNDDSDDQDCFPDRGKGGIASTVEWCSTTGTTYFILVHGGFGESGSFELAISDDGTPCTDAVTCPIIAGACCTECGCEDDVLEDDCVAAGGEFLGVGTSCLPMPDPVIGTTFGPNTIPDDDNIGAEYTVNVPVSFTITDVNVHLHINHTFQGDLVASLVHGGTAVDLFARVGRDDDLFGGDCPDGAEFGYQADNFGSAAARLVIDDEAATPLDCYAGGFSDGINDYAGPAHGPQTLASFAGLDAQGDWLLIVSDRAEGDTGGVVFFGLEFGTDPIMCPGDMEPPMLMGCPDPAVVTLECMPPPPAPVVTATDNCDDDVPVLPASSTVGDSCFRTEHRTWTATDDAGNVAECEQNFVIQDTTGPVLTCQSPIVVTCTGPEGIIGDAVPFDVSAVDACGNGAAIFAIPLRIYPPTCGGPPNIETFTAVDECGNMSTCDVEVNVKGALCCPALVDEELTLMIPNLDFTAQVGHDGGPVTTKAKFDIWNQNEIRFSGLNKCITCWDSTLLSLYPMPNLFLASNIQTDMGRARIDGVPEPQCVGAVATPLLGIITREITFAGCPLPSLRSSRPLTARGTQDAEILYTPIDQRSAEDDALRVGPPENVAGTNRQGALLVWAKVEVKWNFAGEIIRDTFIELTNDGDEFIDFQLYLVNGEGPLDEVRLFGILLERAHQGWNFTDEQIRLTPNEPTYWSANSGAPKGITPFSNLDGGPTLGRPDPDPKNPGGRMVRGFVVGWAVNAAGEEVKYNRLGGRATIVDYAEGSAHEYETWAFRCVAAVADLAEPDGTPGRILLDGMEYDAAPEKLLTQFFVPWSPAFTNRGALENFGGGMDNLP